MSRGNSASKNLQQETSRPKCCLYETPYITGSVREIGDAIARTLPYAQLPTDAPTRARNVLVHKWRNSQETCLLKELTPTSIFYKVATSKSSTKIGLLYMLKESHKEYLQVSLHGYSPLTCCHEHEPQEPWRSTALLGCWGRQSLKGVTSLGTDFETHAIWQGYVEEPAAKDFIGRKARTIALSKAQGIHWNMIKCKERLGMFKSCHTKSVNQPLFTSLEIPWGFLTRAVPVAVLCSLAEAYVMQESRAWGFFE